MVLHPASERAWHAHIHHAPALAPISSEDRIGSTAPVKGRSPAPSAFAAGHGFVRSHLTWERLRTGYAFLVGRAPAIGLDGPETSLTKRLTRAFEGELKIGLRVLTIGVGIVGCWACLVPLSGAVVVPGTLVVESDLKKIQHPAGGVVANIPVRDGMHVSAGDVLLRLDETQLRANAQVLTQQLDQTRVRTTPQLEGLVSYVSADLNHDRQKNPNAGPYYTVRVTRPPSERRRFGGLELVSGMPVEVFLQTGSRTMMS